MSNINGLRQLYLYISLSPSLLVCMYVCNGNINEKNLVSKCHRNEWGETYLKKNKGKEYICMLRV